VKRELDTLPEGGERLGAERVTIFGLTLPVNWPAAGDSVVGASFSYHETSHSYHDMIHFYDESTYFHHEMIYFYDETSRSYHEAIRSFDEMICFYEEVISFHDETTHFVHEIIHFDHENAVRNQKKSDFCGEILRSGGNLRFFSR
jgi:hypothetical protein